MAQWDNYSQKSAPADTDTLMLKDNAATGKPNKRLLFSGLWTWIVDKLTNAVINALQTTTKTVVGGMNNLQNAVTTLNTNAYLLHGGTSVPNNANLNTYTTPGNYIVSANNIATSLTNCPSSRAGMLKVECPTGADTILRQTYTEYTESASSPNGNVYVRVTDNGSSVWRAWQKQPTRAEVDTLNSKLAVERGVYTPTITAGTGFTYDNVSFKYAKQGNILFINGRFNITDVGSTNALIKISIPSGYQMVDMGAGGVGGVAKDSTPAVDTSMCTVRYSDASNLSIQKGAGNHSAYHLGIGYVIIYATVFVA